MKICLIKNKKYYVTMKNFGFKLKNERKRKYKILYLLIYELNKNIYQKYLRKIYQKC